MWTRQGSGKAETDLCEPLPSSAFHLHSCKVRVVYKSGKVTSKSFIHWFPEKTGQLCTDSTRGALKQLACVLISLALGHDSWTVLAIIPPPHMEISQMRNERWGLSRWTKRKEHSVHFCADWGYFLKPSQLNCIFIVRGWIKALYSDQHPEELINTTQEEDRYDDSCARMADPTTVNVILTIGYGNRI